MRHRGEYDDNAKGADAARRLGVALSAIVTAVAFMLVAWATPAAQAANIITVANNPTSCGGSTLCSTNGTTGYTGTQAFDLSTINQWFQIDTNGVSHLAGQVAEPNGGAGSFLVINDTGKTVTNLTLVLTDTFTASTSSVGPCHGLQAGQACDNFSAQIGATSAFKQAMLSGIGFDSCTTGTQVGNTCTNGTGSNAAANFAPNQVIYSWAAGTGGTGIAAGATFDITFASWQTGNSAFATSVPEPSTLAIFGAALAGLGLIGRGRQRGQ